MADQLLAPAAEYWKAAEKTPEPASVEFDERVTAAPPTLEPAAGTLSLPDALPFSTRTLATVADVAVLPTLSVVTTRRSYSPSDRPVVSQLTAYGDVVSVAIEDQLLAPAAEYWK